MSCRLLLACLLLPGVLRAEQPGPQPIEMPDIRANIMKMLKEGRHEGMGSSEEGRNNSADTSAQRPKTSGADSANPAKPHSGQEDLFSIIEEQKKAEKKPAPTPARSEPDGKSTVDVKKQEEPLQLPSKEITIQDADDLKKLIREFDEARKRQQGR